MEIRESFIEVGGSGNSLVHLIAQRRIDRFIGRLDVVPNLIRAGPSNARTDLTFQLIGFERRDVISQPRVKRLLQISELRYGGLLSGIVIALLLMISLNASIRGLSTASAIEMVFVDFERAALSCGWSS
jgi:hypothetical protein